MREREREKERKEGTKGELAKQKQKRGIDGNQDVMVCQSYPLIHAETDAFDHSKSRAQSINTE